MTVVLRGIDATKRAKNDYVTNADTLLTLYEYIEIAKRCIGAFASAPNMLRDDDAIAHVAEHLMLGHLRWKENGGRTLRSYLNQCAIWAIKSWKSKLYKVSQQQELSLNMDSGYCDQHGELYQLIPDKKAREPSDILFNDNEKAANSLINSDCITKLQRYYLTQRYIENKTFQEIGDSVGVSRQAVKQCITKAITKLQNEFAT
jgi:RNA polymerase sigma factor (sigma-70 family)